MKVARRSPLAVGTVPSTAVTELERAPIEGWHTVGGFGEPGYQAPFAARAGEPLKFRKLASGLVELRGACDSTTSVREGTVFTLPVGYRPARSVVAWGYCYLIAPNNQHDFVRVSVFTDGRVYPAPPGPPAGGAVAITFDALRFQLRAG